jgi:hypothetical protein
MDLLIVSTDGLVEACSAVKIMQDVLDDLVHLGI